MGAGAVLPGAILPGALLPGMQNDRRGAVSAQDNRTRARLEAEQQAVEEQAR